MTDKKVGSIDCKKWVIKAIIIICCLLLVGGVGAISFNKTKIHKIIDKKKHENMQLIWPETYLASLIPKPESNNGRILENDEKRLSIEIYRIEQDDFYTYIKRCRANGFNHFDKQSRNSFFSYDSKGNILEILYDNENMMSICLCQSDEFEILQGVEHYEFEFYSYDKREENSNGFRNYDLVIKKYLTPIKTTVKDLKMDFPFEEANKGLALVSIMNRKFSLADSQEIWVYATYLDDYRSDNIKFTYDALGVYTDRLDIQTHFEVIEHHPSSVNNSRLIVISVIPVDQHTN